MCLFFNLIMCGILAIFGHCPTANPNVLKRRGPDFSGSFSEDGVFLYHTRLAIVHPESGAQPIYYKDWVITMNGEIYNASFSKTETDCSWLPKILDEHGPEGIRLLDGIFSFVAYNTKTKEFLKIDVKYLPYRLPAPNRNKLCQSIRPRTPFQVEHNVKFITVDEKGNCKPI